MTTKSVVSDHLLAYLNGEITLPELVLWAEGSMVEGGFEPDADVDMLIDIVMYLAAADTEYFPLTWEVCSEFMRQLGTPIRMVAV